MVLYAMLGGAVGAIARFLLDDWICRKVPGDFPWGIFTANVLGSASLGAVVGIVPAGPAHTALAIGVCGALTTYSTFTAQTLALFKVGKTALALTYVYGSVVACLLAALAGNTLATLIT